MRRPVAQRAFVTIVVTLALAPASASASSFWGVTANGILEQPGGAEQAQLSIAQRVSVTLGRFTVGSDPNAQMSALASRGIEPYAILNGDYGGSPPAMEREAPTTPRPPIRSGSMRSATSRTSRRNPPSTPRPSTRPGARS